MGRKSGYALYGLFWMLWRMSFDPAVAQSPPTPLLTGTITHPELGEVSGLAHSQKHPGILWAINDGGNWAALYALRETGEVVGKVPVLRSVNRDWEDLDAFTWEGRPCLLIADVGDNEEKYGVYTLYLVPEPEPNAPSVLPFGILHFQYEDGPKDCEAVAVEGEDRSVLLITKRTSPPAVYRLALSYPSDDRIWTARKITSLDRVPKPSEEQIARSPLLRYVGQPTALSLSPDGKRAAVLTYTAIWLYTRSESEWDKAFLREPEILSIPLMKQAEGLTFSPDGRFLFLTSENLPAPIYRIGWEEAHEKAF